MASNAAQVYASPSVRDNLSRRIRDLHRETQSGLGAAIGDILINIKELRVQGELSQEEALQFIYDIRNEKGRMMRESSL